MDTATRVPDEAVGILLQANALEKGMNPTILNPAMCKK